MTEQYKLTEAMIAKALAAYHAAGGVDDGCARAALEAAFAQDESFKVGDEVECANGCMTGVILAINGEDAQISWSYRGKSVEHLCNLAHVEDPRLHQG